MFTKQISVVALLRVDLHSHITFSVMETCSSLSCSDLFRDAGQRNVAVAKRRHECQFVDRIDQTTKPVGLRVVSTKMHALV